MSDGFFVQRCLLIFAVLFDIIFLKHKCVNRYVENIRVLTKLKNSVKKDTYFGWGDNNARVFNTPNPQKYWLYNAPADKWVKRMTGYRNQKFTIKRSLARADGSLYYSCYIGDKWIGYINSWGFQNQ